MSQETRASFKSEISLFLAVCIKDKGRTDSFTLRLSLIKWFFKLRIQTENFQVEQHILAMARPGLDYCFPSVHLEEALICKQARLEWDDLWVCLTHRMPHRGHGSFAIAFFYVVRKIKFFRHVLTNKTSTADVNKNAN